MAIEVGIDCAAKAPFGSKVYTALLTQASTDAPTAVELENTFDVTPSFTRTGEGVYSLTMTGQFTANKTVCIIFNETTLAHGGASSMTFTRKDANDLTLSTYSDKYTTLADAELSATPIGIIVYA